MTEPRDIEELPEPDTEPPDTSEDEDTDPRDDEVTGEPDAG